MNILRVRISKTAQDGKDYVEIISNDQTSLSIVLTADRIEVVDARQVPRPKAKK